MIFRKNSLSAKLYAIARACLAVSIMTAASPQGSAQDNSPFSGETRQPWSENSLPGLLENLSSLETEKDPKCHATATRLEYLIYGTELEDKARYLKNQYQKLIAKQLWLLGQQRAATGDSLTEHHIAQVEFDNLKSELDALSGDHIVHLSDETLIVSARDLEHYGSVAYSLRALLAVQQEQLLSTDSNLALLEDSAISAIKSRTDLLSLALLQLADQHARNAGARRIAVKHLDKAWAQLDLITEVEPHRSSIATNVTPAAQQTSTSSLLLLDSLIDRKLEAYQAYNEVSAPLFERNLQVYFALARLPSDTKLNAEFSAYFTEAMVHFSTQLYFASIDHNKSDRVIAENAVQSALDQLLPHAVDSYEDVTFFPRFTAAERLKIESYDMDAFRDSGLHWRYLRYMLDDLDAGTATDVDPFAAELLSEGIAHYGLLLLRNAGQIARTEQKTNEAVLDAAHLESARQRILEQNQIHQQLAQEPETAQLIRSQASTTSTESIEADSPFFLPMNEDWGIDAEHRTSDWLNRQMRSYLKRDEQTGIITIPPAFGGAGIAAEDVDGDGLADLLILSGSGNRLYHNTGSGFEDITRQSGLNWLRPQDKLPGEPRQPLIADLDNDGDQDILITYVNDSHRVYRNNGKGQFEDVTEIADLGGTGLVAGPATLVDFNNDGLLDLYVAYFGNYLKGTLPTLKRRNDNGTANQLFINEGNFQFRHVPDALGAANTGWGQALTHTDLNQDGWQDLLVGNDFGINAYYLNRKGLQLVDIARQLGTDKPSYTMNLSLSDLNADGIADVYVSNIVTMNKDENYVLPNADTVQRFDPENLGNMRVIDANDLFLSGTQEGRLQYSLSDVVGRGRNRTGWAWDADFFDADNDGDDDLYVANGMNDYFVYSTRNPYHETEMVKGDLIFPDAQRAPNVFFLNLEGKLREFSGKSGLDLVANTRSVTYLDADNDGDLDVVLNNFNDRIYAYKNRAQEVINNNWVKIKLVGAPQEGVNLDAIGAQILVGFGKDGYVWRQVSSSQGYMSVHPKEQLIGIGKSESARIAVIWPNGHRQQIGVVPANASYQVTYDAP